MTRKDGAVILTLNTVIFTVGIITASSIHKEPFHFYIYVALHSKLVLGTVLIGALRIRQIKKKFKKK